MTKLISNVAFAMTLTATPAAFANKGHAIMNILKFKSPFSENLAEYDWHSRPYSVDDDTCTVVTMHHARKIFASVSQAQIKLKDLLGKTTEASTKNKINAALASLEKAKQEAEPFAGRNNSDEFAVSSIAAKTDCSENLLLDNKKMPGMLSKTVEALNQATTQIETVLNDANIQDSPLNYDGFSKVLIDPIFDAQAEVHALGNAITTRNDSKKAANTQPSLVQSLKTELAKKFPLAFDSTIKSNEAQKQQLAVNKAVLGFLKANSLKYADSAELWKSDLIRPISTASKVEYTQGFLNNLMVDKISNESP